MRVIYHEAQPRFPVAAQVRITKPELGDKVYTKGDNIEDLMSALRSARNGQPVVVAGLRALGNSPTAITDAVSLAESKGKVILCAATGKRTDKECGTMVRAAIAAIRSAASMGERAGEIGSKGGIALAKKRAGLRTSIGVARRIWLDPKIPTNEMARAKLERWSLALLYQKFGKSGRKPGRK